MTKGFKLILIAALLLAGPAEGRPLRILALGTSLTQGYGLPPGTEFTVQLQAALKQAGIDTRIDNAGVSGDTSAGGLSRLEWSLADRPDAAIVELGSNDMLRGIPPAETEKNLRAILAGLQKNHVAVLLAGMRAQANLGAEYAAQFDAIYPRLAKDYKVAFYPFMLDGVALNPKLNQADGMHPNAEGVKVLVARILPLAKKILAPLAAAAAKEP